MKGSGMASAVVMVVMGATLSGCCGGGKQQPVEQTPVKVETNVQTSPAQVQTKSTGEQLVDLQKAYESGAISEQEYKKAKQDVMDKAGKQ